MSRQLKASEELENTYVTERVAYLLPIFEALAPYKISERKKGVNKIPGWSDLASKEARLLKQNYPDERPEAEKTYGTCLRQITVLKKELKVAAKTGLKDAALYHPVNTIITNFGNALSYLFTEYKQQQNAVYREKVDDRRKKENRITLDLTNALKIAHATLLEVKQGQEVDWMDVSCAIALSTGRRMAEVHLSATFNQIGEYEVAFSGQLKGKSRRVKLGDKKVALRDVVFKIPTLLPAELVCLGLKWLGDKDKRFPPDEDTERVNRRWSKVLNLAAKDWDIFPAEERTYHKFRAAYLRACIVNANEDPYDFTDYASSILGDDDEGTINSYKRYELKAGSLTKI
ncbi:hypothetical protein HW132_34945 [Brasilonema sp. CT11]|nr:hypothetical protein [Brasilonema sp. CT11]